MVRTQSGILAPVAPCVRHLFFILSSGRDCRSSLRTLGDFADGNQTVVGLGQSLVNALGAQVAGLKTFPCYTGAGVDVPSTPAAMWLCLRGDDRGEILHRARAIEQAMSPSFHLLRAVDCFQYGSGRDLTGYEDGTENPKGEAALAAAAVAGCGPGLDGASFVAVQKWIHDLNRFESMPTKEQDESIGRRRTDNQELTDAPPSAHVKRTAQESFQPAAFVLRRSMPWATENEAGLMFVAFGKSFDAFEAQLRRMAGKEDGITDAIFKFTRPVSGGYFWCPPIDNGRLDWRALGL